MVGRYRGLFVCYLFRRLVGRCATMGRVRSESRKIKLVSRSNWVYYKTSQHLLGLLTAQRSKSSIFCLLPANRHRAGLSSRCEHPFDMCMMGCLEQISNNETSPNKRYALSKAKQTNTQIKKNKNKKTSTKITKKNIPSEKVIVQKFKIFLYQSATTFLLVSY